MMKKIIRLTESDLMRVVKRVISENDYQDELEGLNHIKKKFLLINNFIHLKTNSVDNNYSIDIYGRKYPNFVVYMHLIEIPKSGNNESEHNYLIKFDVKPNGLEYIKYGEEEGIGKKGWLPIKDLYDDEVDKYMKNAANYAKFKYEMDNAPKLRTR